MKSFFITTLSFVLFNACSSNLLPSSIGEKYSNYAYIPIDPLAVSNVPGNSCNESREQKKLRVALPDQVARLAISQTDINGNISYGPIGISSKNSTYQVNFDYASSDVVGIAFEITRIVTFPHIKQNKKIKNKYGKTSKLIYKTGDTISVYDNVYLGASQYKFKNIYRDTITNLYPNLDSKKSEIVVFPVYIGFGVRLTATIKTTENGVDISSLGGIAAGVEAKKINGTLVTQTLGITGDDIRGNFPVQSEINQSTIQQALIAIGSMKTLVNDSIKTKIEPRVLGFYSPIGVNVEIVNKVITALAEKPTVWNHPCRENKSVNSRK